MMKRLENEISTLKKQLEHERRQNKKNLVEKIQKEINEREIQFIGSYDRLIKRNIKEDINRRRTWCPSTSEPPGEPLPSVIEEGDLIFGTDPINRVSFPNLDLHQNPGINLRRLIKFMS